MRLYEITEEMEALDGLIDSWASNHEGDLSDFPLNDELERLEGERTEKLLNLAVWHKSLKAEADAFKDEIKRLQARQKALSNKAERIKEFIDYSMTDNEKLSDTRCALSYRKTPPKVVIDVDVKALPHALMRVTCEPDKTAIKEYIKEHPDTEIGHLQESYSLQIK